MVPFSDNDCGYSFSYRSTEKYILLQYCVAIINIIYETRKIYFAVLDIHVFINLENLYVTETLESL